jgi:protease I
MADNLNGKRIAFLATDGVEQIELTEPWKAVKDAGAEPVLVAPEPGEILGLNHIDKGDKFQVDETTGDANAGDFDALVLPGGVVNADAIRMDEDAVVFVRDFFLAGKPVGVICHGPWILIEAGVLEARTITSWPSLRTDIENAGATWIDEQCHVDKGLVSSRKPDDLPAFCSKIVEEFAEGIHAEQREAAKAAVG